MSHSKKFLMVADLYAIRHVTTGLYMPALRRPGYSMLEVKDFTNTPRLFWTRGGAAKSLSAWKRGPAAKSSCFTNPFNRESEYDPGGYPLGPPPADRVGASMEIVLFKLTEEPLIYIPAKERKKVWVPS